MTIEKVIECVFKQATSRILDFVESDWTCALDFEVVEYARFSASIIRNDSLTVQIATGCADSIQKLRDTCFIAFRKDAALEWLILHELCHANWEHFEVLDGVPILNLLTRGVVHAPTLDAAQSEDWPKITPCLELQADHEALEMILDDYSMAKWGDLRIQAASIAAVIVLIERADAENGIEHYTHPKAVSRIFQLLGHVAEMWSIPAHAKAKARDEQAVRDEDLPPQVEVQAFSSQVVLPVFWDAVALAEAAEAKSIIADLGSPEDFFADIGRAKLGQWDELVTVGAKEWATLKDVNEAILPLLSNNHAVN